MWLNMVSCPSTCSSNVSQAMFVVEHVFLSFHVQLQDAVSQARASEASHRSHVQSVQAQLAAAQATLTQLANDKATADARVADLYAEAVAARAQALNRAGVAAAAPAADDAGGAGTWGDFLRCLPACPSSISCCSTGSEVFLAGRVCSMGCMQSMHACNTSRSDVDRWTTGRSAIDV